MSAVGAHFALALLLFLVVNWVGARLYRRGYTPLTLLPTPDRAPALNAGVRVVLPLVYLIVVSAALYRLGLDDLVTDIFLVSVYYVVFRWAFNTAWGRARLMNWPRELAIAGLIVFGSWQLYEAVISERVNLLPDPVNLATEVWLVVAAFLFYMLHELGGAEEGTVQRKAAYVLHRARTLRRRYEAELRVGIPGDNKMLESVALAVMVYESFNRPLLARLVEYGAFKFGRARTLGIMQVSTSKMIGDRESVRLGVERIAAAWKANCQLQTDFDVTWAIARSYNPDNDYADEIFQLTMIIFPRLYGSYPHRLTTYEPLMRGGSLEEIG